MNTPATLKEPSWFDAREAAYRAATALPSEGVPLADAVGRVLAEAVLAEYPLPHTDTSAMDGWAVTPGPGPWRLVDKSMAGHPMEFPLAAGTAATIATGGIPPEGTFGVLRREYGYIVEADGEGWLYVDDGEHGEPVERGHIRPAGQEATAGDTLIEAATALNPAHVGLAATAGRDRLEVHRRPRGRLLIMGDEVALTGTPEASQVRDAFGAQLPHFARLLGLETGAADYVPDSLEAAITAISESDADVILTTGGTAEGPADFLHQALEALGGTLIVDMIAMRPGHPMVLASLGDNRFLVGLPGNPLSAMTGMLTLLQPVLRGLLGMTAPELGTVTTASTVGAPQHEHRLVPYRRVPNPEFEGEILAKPQNWLGSGMLRGLAGADAIMVVAPGGVEAGTKVPSLPLPW